MTPHAFALQMIGIVAFVAFAPIGDVRACPLSVSTIQAARGRVICPQPKTTIYPSDKELASCPVNFMKTMKPSKKRDWCQYWSGRMP